MAKKFIFIAVFLVTLYKPLFSEIVKNDYLGIKVNVSASSVADGHKVHNVFDGNSQTRWSSISADNQWVKFEFKDQVKIASMFINWETASAYAYNILLSSDDKTYSPVHSIKDGYEGENIKINFDKAYNAKYLKIDCIERTAQWGFSIWEAGFNDEFYEDTARIPPFLSGKDYFGITQKNNRYYFQSPDGMFFISKGVNVVIPKDGAVKPDSKGYDVIEKYQDMGKWAKSTLERLEKWGFNTIGSWSDRETYRYSFAFTVFLNIPASKRHRLVDVFDKKFEISCEKQIKQSCRRYSDAKYLLGYFVDNELPWYGDQPWHTGHVSSLLDEYMKLPANAPGKKALISFFESKYIKVKIFNRIWNTKFKSFDELKTAEYLAEQSGKTEEDREEFAGIIADKYYDTVVSYIKKYDPNHLILGSRFAYSAPKYVVKACGKYCDVISLNYYVRDMVIKEDEIENIYYMANKPIMITEFSYRAMDNASGNKNAHGADVTVKTQKERAEGFEKYVMKLMDFPYIIGYHWFQYFDQSPGGRNFDGEDSNYGLVDIYDNKYSILVQSMTDVNRKAMGVHMKSSLQYPEDYVELESKYSPVDNSNIKRKKGAEFCKFKNLNTKDILTWGDFPKASINIKKSGKKEDVLFMDYKSFDGWGCGLTLFPDIKPKNSDNSSDFRGFNYIELEAMVPEGVKFYLIINESGVDGKDADEYIGLRGADGESFESDVCIGNGMMINYKYSFVEFKIRTVHGNQNGNKTLNLQAIKNIDIYIPGSNGAGEIKLKNIKLY